jgi:hypothetical protein
MKLELYWLGMLDGRDDYLRLDRLALGSERYYRHEYYRLHETGLPAVDRLAGALFAAGHKKMSLTLASFFSGLARAIGAMVQVLRTGGHLVVKISDSHVRGYDVPTHRLFCEMAVAQGLSKVAAFPDRIGSRSLLTKRNSYSGIIEQDWILIFKKEQPCLTHELT